MRHRSFRKNDKEREFKFSEDDLKELSLLSSALISTYLFTISDIISQKEAIQAGYLEVVSKLILINVDIDRYNHLYKKYINGESKYSLQPELDITIGDGFQVLTYFFITIGFVGIYEVNNISEISIDSTKELSFLNSQLDAINIRFYADYLAYISIIESIQLIYSKYQENKKREENPDIPAIESIICYFLSRVILANVAFNRYDELYKKYGRTQYNYLLQPNIALSVGNVFGIIGCVYLLLGFMERYERNISGPIFGI